MTLRIARNAAASLVAIAAIMLPPVSLPAQNSSQSASQSQSASHPQTAAQKAAEARQSISDATSTAPHNWTTDQIITATVHQAWILSGKNEANFFEIVKELAAISASNRNLTLPDNPAAGRRAGNYIKTQAKADHDQLLYDIVDKSVRMTGIKAPAEAKSTPAK